MHQQDQDVVPLALVMRMPALSAVLSLGSKPKPSTIPINHPRLVAFALGTIPLVCQCHRCGI